jgi:hypothetical protein
MRKQRSHLCVEGIMSRERVYPARVFSMQRSVMHEPLERLERLSVSDLEARREWARALARSGDPRARLIALSIAPGADAWLALCEQLDFLSGEGQGAVDVWLAPLLHHWQVLDLSQRDVSDVSALQTLTNLTSLNLSGTKVRDVSPLAMLTKLTALNLRGTQVSDVTFG